MINYVSRHLTSFGISSLFFCAIAAAQVIDPTQQLKELNEPQPRSSPRSAEVVIATRSAQPPPEAATHTVVPRAIEVDGATALPENTLRSLYSPYVGRETTVQAIYELAAAMTRAYRDAGYVLAEVIVPPQRIAHDGSVRLQAIEGYISEIQWPETSERIPSVLRRYLEKITQSRPLHIETLERALLLANDVPGYRVRAVVAPSADLPGAAVLVLSVDYTAWDFSADVDNSGTDSVGEYRGGAHLTYNGLTGRGEQTGLSYSLANDPKELQQASFSHMELLGDQGTRLQFTAQWSQVRPGGALAIYDIEGDLWMQELSLTHPIVRLRNQNLVLRAGVGNLANRSSILGVDQIRDDLRYLFVNLNYDFADQYRGVNLLSAELRQGLDIFDATANSRVGARPDFTMAKLYAARNQSLTSRISLYAAAFGQYAFNHAPSTEEPSFGGPVLGRGYDRSEITGDYGLGTKLELRYTATPPRRLKGLEFYSFWDVAAVWEGTKGQVLGNGQRRQSLASAGAGARFRLTERVSGYLEVAQPLTKGVSSEGGARDPRFNFELRFGL